MLTPATAGRVGAMLLAENARSVNHCYDEDDWEPVYLFHPLPGTPDPLVVLKAITCLEYQSCEHDGWLDSEARVFCQALRRVVITELPGYSAAEGWPIETRTIFQRPRSAPRWVSGEGDQARGCRRNLVRSVHWHQPRRVRPWPRPDPPDFPPALRGDLGFSGHSALVAQARPADRGWWCPRPSRVRGRRQAPSPDTTTPARCGLLVHAHRTD